MSTRRAFLKNGGLALFGIGVGGVPTFVANAAMQQKNILAYKKGKILVCIFQRGAMDGLMAVTPFADKYLKTARPNLFLDPSIANGNNALIDIDGYYGLHPSFKEFAQLFANKQLAIVHGVGSPNATRSHFDAQDYMESGTPFNKGTASGWLNRAVGLMGHDASPFKAVSLTNNLPRSFYGDNATLAIGNLNDFAIDVKNNKQASNIIAKSFEDLYDATSNNLLKTTSKESFDAIKILKQANLKNYIPANNAQYPTSPLGKALLQIAQLIKMDVGLEIAFAESAGWDTHFNQGVATGIFARNAADINNAVAAFWSDLGQLQDNVTILTMTEFGRTVKENGTRGTDHGRASCSFLLGNNVNGGIVYGNKQPLAIENLEDRRDLAVTTDFRHVFNNLASKHLNITTNNILFPNFKATDLGLIK
jgi:uncharacterized protein (DUF1501 family)